MGITALSILLQIAYDYLMLGRAKVGIAAVMLLVAVATTPAMLCLGYLAQNTHSHSCCPEKTPPGSTIVPTCCVHSPAVTSQIVDVQAPSLAAGVSIVVAPFALSAALDSATDPDLDTSPLQCSSVLRI